MVKSRELASKPLSREQGEGNTAQHVITIHLQNIPLLNSLPSELLQQIGGSMLFKKAGKGDYILHKGSNGDHLLFLLAGRLRVVDLTEDGREIGLSFLEPGDYFGELSIIDGQPRSASVIATENALIGLLPAPQARALIYSNPLVAERVLARLALKIRSASDYRAILGLPTAFQRIFALLMQFMRVAPGGLHVIDDLPTQQEISLMSNTSRETVSRAINLLIREGIVEKDLRRLIVRKPAMLKKKIEENEQMQ